MFLAHYGLAFAAKRLARCTSLGSLIFAAELADEVWPFLLLAGVEHVRIVPGLMAASPLDFVDYPITHSLLTQVAAGFLVAIAYFLLRRVASGTLAMGLLVISHWFLDLIVHRPDLPIRPGGPRVGLGLWQSVPWTLTLELIFFGAGVLIYLRTTEAIDRTGKWALWGLIGCLGLLYAGVLFGPPPESVPAIAYSSLGLWLFVPWGAWVDRHRVVRKTVG